MKSNQSNIVYTLILSACFFVINGHAQGTTTADSTRPLPIVPYSMTVVFVEFEITAKSNGNQINWSTILETNLGKYEIQRSTSNQSFETIATVQAKGSNAVTVNYTFTDTKPLNGKNIYRLKMVDTRNGVQFTANKIISGNMQPVEIKGFQVYPNPVRPGTSLTLNVNNAGKFAVKIINLAGKVLFTTQVVNAHFSPFNMQVPANFSAGMYVVDVTEAGNNQHYQQKIIIQ
ncbi:MAG: T9SS type A sorting domain-containing protein [Chitinophagaceae bacterium]